MDHQGPSPSQPDAAGPGDGARGGESGSFGEPWEAIVRSSVDGILAVDRQRRVRVWNPAMERLTELAAERCRGLGIAEVGERVGAPELSGLLERALAGELVVAPRRRVVRAGGGEQFLELQCGPVVDHAGEVIGALGVMHDVTQQHQLEEQLLQAQKIEAVGQLAGGIAHDFNNLLTVILGYCEIAQMRATDVELAADLPQVRRAAERASVLTRQLLAFSRKQVLQAEPIDVNAEVRELEDMLGRVLGEDVDLATSLAPRSEPWSSTAASSSRCSSTWR